MRAFLMVVKASGDVGVERGLLPYSAVVEMILRDA
jgi:hypothetical protein